MENKRKRDNHNRFDNIQEASSEFVNVVLITQQLHL